MTDQKERAELTRLVMQILDDWKVEADAQIRLLGLPEKTRTRALNRYRQGEPLPDDGTTDRRISCLLSIQRSLQTALPHNAAMAGVWVTSPNPILGNQTPLVVMLSEGLTGMEKITEILQHRGEW